MLDAQTKQILRVGCLKISTAGVKISTSTLAMLAAFCISEQGMRSARGQETSQISTIKMGNLEQVDEWEHKQEKMLKQKVVPVLLSTLLIFAFWH